MIKLSDVFRTTDDMVETMGAMTFEERVQFLAERGIEADDLVEIISNVEMDDMKRAVVRSVAKVNRMSEKQENISYNIPKHLQDTEEEKGEKRNIEVDANAWVIRSDAECIRERQELVGVKVVGWSRANSRETEEFWNVEFEE